jgi:peptide/nickel transport system permease protein
MAVNPVALGAPTEARAGRPRPGALTVLGRFIRKKPLGAAGGLIILIITLTAVFAELVATYDPIATDASQTLASPSADHWLGSDHLGRDVYSRVVHGARVSLIVGLASTLMGSFFGGIIGLLSGYAGGKTDLITQRVLDIFQGLPLLVLAMVMSAALGPSIQNVVIAISIPIIPRAARVIRSSVLSIRRCSTSRRPARWACATSASPSATFSPTPWAPSSCS